MITSKAKSYEIYEAGGFGNKPRTWTSPKAYFDDGAPCDVTMRYKVPQSKFCKYNIPPEKVQTQVDEWAAQGAKVELKVCFVPKSAARHTDHVIQSAWGTR
jgi:hypothetical protein